MTPKPLPAGLADTPHSPSPNLPLNEGWHFQLMVQSIQDYAVFMLDPAGRIATWNLGAQRLKGYSAEEIIGSHFSRFYPEEDKAAAKPQRELDKAEREGVARDEGWRIRKDGSRFWAYVVITALRDAQGTLVGYAKVTRDMTEKLLAEEAVRKSEERLRIMIDAVKDYAIYMLDPNGNIATWNSGAEHLKGYRASEIIGAHLSKFYTDEDVISGRPAWEIETAVRLGRVQDEGWRVRKNGSKFWANVVLTALRDKEGNLIGFTKVTKDATERKEAEEALKNAYAELEQRVQERTSELLRSNKELEQFTYVASHDLQEPIRKIITYSERLAHRAMDDDEKAHLNKLSAAGYRLREVVQDLLNYSQVSQTQPAYEWVNLAELLEEVQSDLEVRIAETGTEIRYETLPEIKGNRGQLRHLFQNMLSNAMKFVKKGTAPVIEIKTRVIPGEAVEVSISDNGIGIDPKYTDKIFRPFHRLHTRAEYEGSGIGLSIVKKIIDYHGGKIRVQSQPGFGTTFFLAFPLSPRPLPFSA